VTLNPNQIRGFQITVAPGLPWVGMAGGAVGSMWDGTSYISTSTWARRRKRSKGKLRTHEPAGEPERGAEKVWRQTSCESRSGW